LNKKYLQRSFASLPQFPYKSEIAFSIFPKEKQRQSSSIKKAFYSNLLVSPFVGMNLKAQQIHESEGQKLIPTVYGSAISLVSCHRCRCRQLFNFYFVNKFKALDK